MGLFASVWEPEALVMLCFVFAAAGVFVNGGTYSDSLWLGGIGLLTAIPVYVVGSIGHAFLGGAALPLFVVGLLAYIAFLKQSLGPVGTLALCGSMVLLLCA